MLAAGRIAARASVRLVFQRQKSSAAAAFHLLRLQRNALGRQWTADGRRSFSLFGYGNNSSAQGTPASSTDGDVIVDSAPALDSFSALNAPPSDVGSIASTADTSVVSEALAKVDLETAGSAVAQASELLHAAGLSSTWPPGWIQYAVTIINQQFGVPWWAAIIGTLFAIRIILLPLQAFQTVHTNRLAVLQVQVKPLQNEMQEALQMNDLKRTQELGEEIRSIFRQHKTKVIYPMAGMFVQGPVFVSVFFGLRGLAYANVGGFSTGGTLWFPDLTVADPYYCLPLLLSALIIKMIPAEASVTPLPMDISPQKMAYAMSALSFLVVATFPSAMQLYFVGNTAIQVVTTRLITHYFPKPPMPKVEEVPFVERVKSEPGYAERKERAEVSFREMWRKLVEESQKAAEAAKAARAQAKDDHDKRIEKSKDERTAKKGDEGE